MKPSSAKAKYRQAKDGFDYLWQRVKINPDTGCVEWTAAVDRDGYGQISGAKYNHGLTRAHRLSYFLYNGEIPQGMCVLHHCDNPSCVNPWHLFLGTIQDNNADKRQKNRQRNGSERIVDWEKVVSLRATHNCKEVATLLGISYSMVCHIWRKHGYHRKKS